MSEEHQSGPRDRNEETYSILGTAWKPMLTWGLRQSRQESKRTVATNLPLASILVHHLLLDEFLDS
jgi:hypothetical protein